VQALPQCDRRDAPAARRRPLGAATSREQASPGARRMDLARGHLAAAQEALYSLSSGAAAESVAELFVGVAPRNPLMHPAAPYVAIALYLASKPLLARAVARAGVTGESPAFRAGALAHNAALCAYSLWTAAHVVPLTVAHVRRRGALDAYCGSALWEDAADGTKGLGFWAFLFYVSKIWEVGDTYLLIAKRRRPSYLQVYHHASTILCAYWLTASRATVSFVFVGFNSTVHTVMYLYFALATVGVRLPGKSLITSLQIAQFVVGITLAMPMFFLEGGACANPAQKFAVAAIIASVLKLIVLFSAFYARTYAKKVT
jgi:GNS1/SUR4 family